MNALTKEDIFSPQSIAQAKEDLADESYRHQTYVALGFTDEEIAICEAAWQQQPETEEVNHA